MRSPGTNALTCVASPKRCITSSLHAYASTHGPAINAAAEAAGVLHMLASTRVDTLRRKVYRPRLCSARLRTASCRFSFAISINCRADFVSTRLYLKVGELHLFGLHQVGTTEIKAPPNEGGGSGLLALDQRDELALVANQPSVGCPYERRLRPVGETVRVHL